MSKRGPVIKGFDDIKIRLEQRVVKDPVTGCWNWQGYTFNGYARISFKRLFPATTAAYRISYLVYRGDIASGMEVDHLCRNRLCINPKHLEVVTHAENTRRAVYPIETHRNGRKTHCKRGHPFDDRNTMIVQGKRQCRVCVYAKNDLLRRRKQEAA